MLPHVGGDIKIDLNSNTVTINNFRIKELPIIPSKDLLSIYNHVCAKLGFKNHILYILKQVHLKNYFRAYDSSIDFIKRDESHLKDILESITCKI